MTWQDLAKPAYPADSKVKIVLVEVQRRLSRGWAAAHHLSYRFVTGMLPADIRTLTAAGSARAKSRRLKQ